MKPLVPSPLVRTLVAPPALAEIRHVALDMDGTIYSGNTLFPSTLPFLELLKNLQIGYTFLTNNSSKSRQQYLLALAEKGVPASTEQFYTSTDATVEWMKRELPLVRKLFVLGTEGLRQEFALAGFAMAEDDAADEPDAIVVGFDTALIFARLCRAAYWIKHGKPFIATHPDLVCPTDQPTVLVDCGSICAALQKAAGRGPDRVLGKPDPSMLEALLRKRRLAPGNLAMVGDRLYTDMAMAKCVGALGVLVLTGETTTNDLARHQHTADLVVNDLWELGRLLLEARTEHAAELSRYCSANGVQVPVPPASSPQPQQPHVQPTPPVV